MREPDHAQIQDVCFMIRLTDGAASINPNPRLYRAQDLAALTGPFLSPAHKLVLVNVFILLKLSFGSGL